MIDITIQIAAILSLMTLSYIYKENIFFRFAEYTVIGAGVGNTVVVALKNVNDIAITNVAVKGNILYILPIIAGILLFTRFSKKYQWLSRYGMAPLVGLTVGTALRLVVISQFTQQIKTTILPLYVPNNPMTSLNNILLVTGVFSTISYFIFTREQVGPLRITSRIGRVFMMATFGASYGTGLITRTNYVIARIEFLLITWLGLAK